MEKKSHFLLWFGFFWEEGDDGREEEGEKKAKRLSDQLRISIKMQSAPE